MLEKFQFSGVRILASKLVEQWLKIARSEIPIQNSNVINKENLMNSQTQNNVKPMQMFNDQNVDNQNDINTVDRSLTVSQLNDDDDDMTDSVNDYNENDSLIFKITTTKDGKQTLAKVIDSSPKKNASKDIDLERAKDKKSNETRSKDGKEREKSKDRHDKYKKSSSSSTSSSSLHKSSKTSSSKQTSGSSSSKSSSNNNSSKTHKSSSHKSSSNSSNSSSSRDKDRHKKSSSSSSSKDKEKDKDKAKSDASKAQAEKDKDTLAKIQSQALPKVGKIPKKTNSDDMDKNAIVNASSTEANSIALSKKKSISIEVRKDTENRPKTVKTYNSQFRSHGLAEEAPPPPSRRDLKKPSTVPSTALSIATASVAPKRSLSPTNVAKEIDKKIKLATSPTTEKPGAIKLIPPKPKRKYFIENSHILIEFRIHFF